MKTTLIQYYNKFSKLDNKKLTYYKEKITELKIFYSSFLNDDDLPPILIIFN